MSDAIKHECGIAMIRLLKPLEYYHEKYGTAFYGLNKLHLLMQKQRNRGQDGAGMAVVKLDMPPGTRYLSRKRSNSPQSVKDVFRKVFEPFENLKSEQIHDPAYLKTNMPYMGELLLGHLRYGTHGSNSLENVHPFLRQSNWISRNLILAGNFNMTNVDELFGHLIKLGQYPKEKSDTVTVLEKIGHFLDDEVQRLFNYYKGDQKDNVEITQIIAKELDLLRVLSRASRKFDGGYAMIGMIGHGDAFMMRDPNGIRPAFYYQDDEVVVTASERPAIQTAFNVPFGEIKELKPAHALIIKKDGRIFEAPFTEPQERISCSFERIYFSRGTDRDIYNERKKLGELLARPVLEAVNYDFKNTVFSFIPNTAETAYLGMAEGIHKILNHRKAEDIKALGTDLTTEKIEEILSVTPRMEKIAVKDDKLRTFITDDSSRDEMVSHVYDVTYGIVKNEVDTLVLLDDSIVRGTTLKNSIIRIVARLKPKKIIIVSSAPQIRFPDCYGIDMSRMGEFVAFNALVRLLEENKLTYKLHDTLNLAEKELSKPVEEQRNVVKDLYDTFSYDQITAKITEIVTPDNIKPDVQVIYQTIENLHIACPDHKGDWYFSGDFPTQGGMRVANQAFVNYMKKINVRAY